MVDRMDERMDQWWDLVMDQRKVDATADQKVENEVHMMAKM